MQGWLTFIYLSFDPYRTGDLYSTLQRFLSALGRISSTEARYMSSDPRSRLGLNHADHCASTHMHRRGLLLISPYN